MDDDVESAYRRFRVAFDDPSLDDGELSDQIASLYRRFRLAIDDPSTAADDKKRSAAIANLIDAQTRLVGDIMARMDEHFSALNARLDQIEAARLAPIEIVREKGRAVAVRQGDHVRNVVSGPDGRPVGLQ